MCRTRGNCSIFEGIHYLLHTTKLLHVEDKKKLYYFLRNSLRFTYYKITTCVGQEGTVVFLKELTLRFAYYKITTCVELDETVEFFR